MKNLKNGTDIRGTAIGENPTLTPAIAELLGKAFAFFLEKKGVAAPVTVAVGRDPRISGDDLKKDSFTLKVGDKSYNAVAATDGELTVICASPA